MLFPRVLIWMIIRFEDCFETLKVFLDIFRVTWLVFMRGLFVTIQLMPSFYRFRFIDFLLCPADSDKARQVLRLW